MSTLTIIKETTTPEEAQTMIDGYNDLPETCRDSGTSAIVTDNAKTLQDKALAIQLFLRCSYHMNQKELSAPHQHLTIIPPKICMFRTLQVLNLSNNQLTSIPSRAFIGCQTLKRLDLSHNHLICIRSGAFTNLLALEHLDLSHNHFTFISPEIFADLPPTLLRPHLDNPVWTQLIRDIHADPERNQRRDSWVYVNEDGQSRPTNYPDYKLISDIQATEDELEMIQDTCTGYNGILPSVYVIQRDVNPLIPFDQNSLPLIIVMTVNRLAQEIWEQNARAHPEREMQLSVTVLMGGSANPTSSADNTQWHVDYKEKSLPHPFMRYICTLHGPTTRFYRFPDQNHKDRFMDMWKIAAPESPAFIPATHPQMLSSNDMIHFTSNNIEIHPTGQVITFIAGDPYGTVHTGPIEQIADRILVIFDLKKRGMPSGL